MGFRIVDLQGASLPLTGSELIEVEQGGNSRSVRLHDLLPGFEDGSDVSRSTSKLAAFVSSQARSLESLFADSVRIDVMMGLVPNDPSFDNATVLNQILATAAAQGVPVDGFGATFYVDGPVEIPAKLRMRRATFKSMGAPVGDMTAVHHIPVLQFSGLTSAITRVVLDEVWSDGSRDKWPNVYMSAAGPEGGGGEDGGMHAWRMIGAVRDSYFRNCGAINAASAGLCMHNPLPSMSVADFVKRNLVFDNFTATGNGEHGWFVDGARDIKFNGGKFTGNGLDMNTTDPLTHGSRGRRDTNGKLFGAPFDIECYGIDEFSAFLGSLVTDISVIGADCRGNAIMPVFYNPIPSNLAGFVTAENMVFTGCLMDSGLAVGADRPDGLDGVAFNISGNKVGATWPIGVVIADGAIMKGRPQGNCIKRYGQSGGFIESTVNKAIMHNCGIVSITAPSNAVGIIVTPQPDVTLIKTAGTAAATITKTLRATRAASQCGIELGYEVAINGALAAGGVFAANVVPPPAYIIGSIAFEITTTAAVPVGKSASLNITAGTATLFVDSSTGANLAGTLKVTILPSE